MELACVIFMKVFAFLVSFITFISSGIEEEGREIELTGIYSIEDLREYGSKHGNAFRRSRSSSLTSFHPRIT